MQQPDCPHWRCSGGNADLSIDGFMGLESAEVWRKRRGKKNTFLEKLLHKNIRVHFRINNMAWSLETKHPFTRIFFNVKGNKLLSPSQRVFSSSAMKTSISQHFTYSNFPLLLLGMGLISQVFHIINCILNKYIPCMRLHVIYYKRT